MLILPNHSQLVSHIIADYWPIFEKAYSECTLTNQYSRGRYFQWYNKKKDEQKKEKREKERIIYFALYEKRERERENIIYFVLWEEREKEEKEEEK